MHSTVGQKYATTSATENGTRILWTRSWVIGRLPQIRFCAEFYAGVMVKSIDGECIERKADIILKQKYLGPLRARVLEYLLKK